MQSTAAAASEPQSLANSSLLKCGAQGTRQATAATAAAATANNQCKATSRFAAVNL